MILALSKLAKRAVNTSYTEDTVLAIHFIVEGIVHTLVPRQSTSLCYKNAFIRFLELWLYSGVVTHLKNLNSTVPYAVQIRYDNCKLSGVSEP